MSDRDRRGIGNEYPNRRTRPERTGVGDEYPDERTMDEQPGLSGGEYPGAEEETEAMSEELPRVANLPRSAAGWAHLDPREPWALRCQDVPSDRSRRPYPSMERR